jgi:hypothetical protein
LKQRIKIQACNGHDAQIDSQGDQKITGNPEKLKFNIKKRFAFIHHSGIRISRNSSLQLSGGGYQKARPPRLRE